MKKNFYLFIVNFYYKIFYLFVFLNKKINTEYQIERIEKLSNENDFLVYFIDINKYIRYSETIKNIFVNKNLINYFNNDDAKKIGTYAAKIYLRQQKNEKG